ncbi:hypothetical protein BDZ89DRAFT_808633 [Hymenopellis radicata]|nr:hypothetical protein BDZ89DRAFT_808633 [Hymenopellis radicata]
MPQDILPKRTAKLSIHPGYQNIQHLFRSPTSPRTVTELLALPDHPIIALHLTMFADVTCIGFSIPHCFADMLGVGIILDAWCAVLAGNAPPPLYEEDNILASFGAVYPETEEGVRRLREKKLSSMQVPSAEEGNVGYDAIQEEERMLFVPCKVIEKYRAEGFHEFRARGLADAWIGEHDVLTAMLMKLNLSQYPSTANDTPHVMAFTANLRGRIPLLPESPPVYLHNAVTIMTVRPIPICELKGMSIGQIALRIRETIISQRTPDELEHTMCIMKETARLGRSPRFFDSTQRGFMVSSWVSKEWMSDRQSRMAWRVGVSS